VIQLSKADRRVLSEMGENGRQYFLSHFDHESLVGELIGHFEHILETESKT